MANPLLSEIPFGSYLVYSPRGKSEVSVKSRRVRDAIKNGREGTVRNIVAHLAKWFANTELAAVLGPDVTLVPAPRSGVLVEGGLWPPRLIADQLVAVGLGREVVPCLARVEAVPKSAFQAAGQRPNARRHYDTMRVNAELLTTRRITIVDDFLTKGNTLLGGASRIAEAFPKADVSAFGLVRTKGLQPEIDEIVEACVGVIRRGRGDEAEREP